MPGERVARVFMRKKSGEKQRASDKPMIFTIDLLRPLFHLPIKTAALHVNLCPTALKSVCRKLGMLRWPFKQFKKASRLSPPLLSATESECSSPPHDPQPNSTELPTFDKILLELPLPGEDDSSVFAENHFLLPLSARASHDFAPLSASPDCPWSVAAAPVSHALAPPMQESTSLVPPTSPPRDGVGAMTFGWEPELERVARMHEHLFPSLYIALRQDKRDQKSSEMTFDAPRGHDLSFLSAGIDSMDCQG